MNEITTNEFPAPAYAITIQPDAATMRTVSNTGGIGLNGADRVTIDGRFGGAGRYLTFRSTSAGSTIVFIKDASNNIVRNCFVEGAGSSVSTGAVIFFITSRMTGNNNNLITGCQIRDLSPAYGVPDVLIGSNGKNLGNTVANNELFNFDLYGIYIPHGGDESWTISGNEIYEVKTSIVPCEAIQIYSGGINIISDNYIHDLLTSGVSSAGIEVVGPGAVTIARNRITALHVNTATTKVYGIYSSGDTGSTLNVVNNQITLIPDTAASRSLYGIYEHSLSGSVVNVFHNSVVLGGTESGTSDSWAIYRDYVGAHTARNNLFLNLRTGGTGSHFAAGSQFSSTYTVSHNVYAGTGATAANFMYFGKFVAVPVSFTTWQSSTGDTNSQAGVAGTGNFTAAMFVSAATGDLHLVPGGNVLVNGLGIPIAGVTTDFDGDFRSATAPTIGADEVTLPRAFSTWAAANGVANDPNAPGANGVKNLLNFAFGISPITGGPGGLQYAGTFAGNGAITATGLPVTMLEGADLRALFVRRKNHATEGVSYTPQFSADLATWTNSEAVPVVLADDGVNQIVSVPFPAFIAGQTASFFRLGVTLAP